MSRLEKALEKATKKREEKKTEEKIGENAERSVSEGGTFDAFDTGESLKIDNPYIVTATEPDSPISEEYRKLKSLVVKLTKSNKFHNTIMVTSTAKDEGKSITSLNLAITLAQEYDHTVLLVDADLRQPAIHEYFGINPKFGLTDCLVNGVQIRDALIKTGIGKLVVLPAGSKVSNPVELVSSHMMKELVKELKNRYKDRYVIIDTPPLLPFAEAHSIVSVVDGTILVVREGRVSPSQLKEVMGFLKGTNILGIVYNDAEIDRFNGRYYYQYYKSYYSHKKKEPDRTNNPKGWLRSLKGRLKTQGKSE